MKQISLIIFILMASFLNSNGRTSPGKPDFAFPKTVEKDARAALDQAQKKGDANAAIDALLQIYTASVMIDYDSVQSVIATVDTAAGRFGDDKLACVFDLLKAQIYSNYLENNYQAINRETPLQPLPADISEWSGAQLCMVTDSLCRGVLAKADVLATVKLSDCNFVDKESELTTLYYPTLLDFACCLSMQMYSDMPGRCAPFGIDGRILDVIDIALRHAPEGSAPAVLWTYEQVCAQKHSDLPTIRPVVEKYLDNPYAGLMLARWGDSATPLVRYSKESFDGEVVIADDDDEDEIDSNDNMTLKTADARFWVGVFDRYLRRFPDTPFAAEIEEQRADYLHKSVVTTMSDYCSPGTPLTVEIENDNVPRMTVSLYRLDGTQGDDFDVLALKRYAATHSPVQSVVIEHAADLPFYAKNTATLVAPSFGEYVVDIDFEGQHDYILAARIRNSRQWTPSCPILKCYTAFPVTVGDVANPLVAVTDPVTGFPLKGVKVWVKGVGGKSTTDAEGVAAICTASRWGTPVYLDHNGKICSYINVAPSPYRDDNDSETRYSASVITDRALYHPGDSLYMLGVVTTSNAEKRISSLAAETDVCVRLRNANYKVVAEQQARTDAYGRVATSFEIPADGLTGNFSVLVCDKDGNQLGSRSVTVSDYRLPDFYIDLLPAARNVPSEGSVTIRGKAVTYSGMPLAGVTVTISVKGGSWWYAEQLINTTEATTDADGSFTAVLDKAFFEMDNPASFRLFRATCEGVSPSGTTATATQGFSMGKPYMINVSTSGKVDALKPFLPKVTAIDPDGDEAALAMRWTITGPDTLAGDWDGKPIDLARLTPGKYTIKVSPVDSVQADESSASFSLYNTHTDIVPTDNYLWVATNDITVKAGEKPEILYGTTADKTCVYIVRRVSDTDCDIRTVTVGRGYHTYRIDDLPGDVESVNIHLFCVKDWKQRGERVTLRQVRDTRLDIACETFRDRLVPMSAETWKFTIVGADGKPVSAALALDMYNKALDALRPNYQGIGFPSFSRNWYVSMRSASLGYSQLILPGERYESLRSAVDEFAPAFNYISMISGGHPVYVRGLGGVMMKRSAPMQYAANMVEDYAMIERAPLMEAAYDSEEMELAEEATIAGGAEPTPSPANDFRESDLPLAIWEPMLTTDPKGHLSYTFTVPNAVTTWHLRGFAWDQALELGSVDREFVASKPVMVQPNVPRFMRVGDKLTLRTLVMNNTDDTAMPTVVIETFNPADGRVIASDTIQVEIAPMATETVSYKMDAPADLSAVGLRVRATSGLFSDGEQNVIRVLTNDAALVETTPFYLNPGEKDYTMKLPKGKDMRLTLDFCENPAWTIVSALPGLRQEVGDYANSAAAAIFSALVARGLVDGNPVLASTLRQWQECPGDSALVSMLEKNDDLKIALLTATPWVQAGESDTQRMARLAMIFDKKEIDKAVAQGTKILAKLQRGDGGWAWGDWCDRSSMRTTENVLDMVYELRSYGWWPDDKKLNDMVARAVRYLDDKVEDTDVNYTLIRHAFAEVPVSANGRKVIGNTLKAIESGWKDYTSVSYKSMAAIAAWNNGKTDLGRQIMSSVSEFGVWTKQQGLKFPSVNSLFDYAGVLEGYARILPGAPEVDGLRQQLIVRKQATDWGTAVVTTEVVSSILSTGTDWTVAASGATVSVDDREIKPDTPIENATGQMRADLSAYAGKTLTVTTTGAGPAYGAVYAQYTQRMTDVKAVSIDDLSIEKTLLVRRGNDWQPAADLRVGDRVKVQLTIHTKRNMDYVEVIDERPAAFEPVNQLPGWVYSEGTAFYRENRDSYTALHVEWLTPGTYLLTYEMNVNTAGTYSSGVATIQSQYAPALTAHSSGTILQVND